jgi:uncharacterized protein YaaQ
MKVILCITSNPDSDQISNKLLEQGYRVTKFASTAGFFGGGTTTLMIGLKDALVKSALDIIRDHFPPPQDQEDKKLEATIYVLDTLGFDQI